MKILVILVCVVVALVAAKTIRNKRDDHDDVCLATEWRDGWYFARDLTRCNWYYHCQSEGDVDPISSMCPVGLFYKHMEGCRVAANIECSNDPCIGSSMTQYAHDSVCGGYCQCENGRTIGCMCCDSNESYQGGSCVASTSCTDVCQIEDEQLPCGLLAVAGKPYHYTYPDPNNPDNNPEMRCGDGTIFSQADCACVHSDAADATVGCQDECYLPFDTSLDANAIRDPTWRCWINEEYMSSPKFATSPAGFTGSSMASFSGQGTYLKVPYFKEYSFQDSFQVRFDFRATGSLTIPGAAEVLLSNRYCDLSEHTIEITYNRGDNSVTASVRTLVGTATARVTGVQVNQWYTVTLQYNGANLNLRVGSNNDNQPLTGFLPVMRTPLRIGGTCNAQGLHGYMDEWRIWNCDPSE